MPLLAGMGREEQSPAHRLLQGAPGGVLAEPESPFLALEVGEGEGSRSAASSASSVVTVSL